MSKICLQDILIIEDETVISEKIVKKLSSFADSEKIKKAFSISDSLKLLNTKSFNIIILDINLKDGNGIDILNWVKENRLKLKVYVFSINSELEKICLMKGASAFFDKSKDLEKLILAVKTNCLENHQ